MRPLGRRPLPTGERLGEIIAVNVSPSMRERLEREAQEAGYQSLSKFIREWKLGPLQHTANAR